MNLIRVLNVCGGFIFGTALLGGIQAITRQQANLINAGIISQSGNTEGTKSFGELASNEQGLIYFTTFQAGVGAALACLREKRHE